MTLKKFRAHLLPVCGSSQVPNDFSHHNALDSFNSFFVNHYSSHFWLLFGYFLTVWQKNDQKVTEKEMKNEMKNGYCETPGT